MGILGALLGGLASGLTGGLLGGLFGGSGGYIEPPKQVQLMARRTQQQPSSSLMTALAQIAQSGGHGYV